MKTRLLLIPLVLALAHAAWAAGTCKVTNITTTQNANSRIPDAESVIVTLVCTADSSAHTYPSTTIPLTGSYPSGSLLNAYNLTGFILYQVGQTPGATAPTAGYTVTVTDADSFALDLGLLTGNGSATVAQLTAIGNTTTLYPVVRSALTVAITGNSVNSAVITLDLIFRTSGALASLGAPGVRWEQHTAAGVAELDFTTCLAGTPHGSVLTFAGVTNATSGTIGVQVSTNGGSTYDATSGHYSENDQYVQFSAGSATGVGTVNAITTQMDLSGQANSDTKTYDGTFTLTNLGATAVKLFQNSVTQWDGTNGYLIRNGFKYTQTGAINALRVISSTTFSGTVTCTVTAP